MSFEDVNDECRASNNSKPLASVYVPSSALILKISPRGGDRLLYSFNSFNKSYISFDTQSFHYTHF